jgi:hypothetical protein
VGFSARRVNGEGENALSGGEGVKENDGGSESNQGTS